MLWIDKYRPTKMSELSFNNDFTNRLKQLCEKDIPHLIFGGPDGCGKKTRIMACLHEIYGNNVYKTRIQHRQYKLPSKKTIDLTTIASNYHIEIDITEARHGNRVIIQEVVDEITASNGCLAITPLKIIVLYHAEYLTKQTQHSLRKTMEQYSSTCRFILSTNSFSKIIDQLHSRAFAVRIEAPSINTITNILNDIIAKHSSESNTDLCTRIAIQSNHNLSKAIMILQRIWISHNSLNNKNINLLDNIEDWERYIYDVVDLILSSQNTRHIVQIRGHIYELMGKCIEPSLIFKQLLFELLNKVDASLKDDIMYWACKYEHYMVLGGKPIIHIEGFIAKCMEIYRNFALRIQDISLSKEINDFEEIFV
jgi:replication factor C subunit 3/5